MTPSRAIGAALLFLFVCSLVAVGNGPMLDDWWLLYQLEQGHPAWDLFSLSFSDVPHCNSWYLDRGSHMRFFRPLASLSFALDATWFPPWVWHLENSAWLVLASLAAVFAYRQVSTNSTWWMWASVLYMLDDAHAGVWAWPSHRSALMAVAFSLLSFGLFVRKAWTASLLCLVVGLFCGELALVGLGLVLAWVATVDRGAALKAVPLLAVGVGFRLVTTWMGFGADVSGMYVDPVRSPAAFVTALLERAPLLFLSQCLPIWVEATGTAPALRDLHLSIGLGITAVVLVAAWALRHRLLATPQTRFFSVALLLTLLPLAAVQPHDRLLLLPGFAFFGLLAHLLSPRLAGAYLAVEALLIVPKALFVGRLAHGMSAAGVDPQVPEGPAYVLRDQGFYNSLLVATRANQHGHDLDLRPLARSHGEVTFTRTGRRQLTAVTQPGRHFFDGPSDHMGLGVKGAAPGTVFEGRGFEAVVLEVHETGHPTAVRFDFPTDLDGLQFVELRNAGFVDWTLPAVGGSLVLPAQRPISLLLLDDL